MLKRRLIPKLQLKAAQLGATRQLVLVTTLQFQDVIPVGEPVSQAKIYQAQAADELIFLDLDASPEQRDPMADIVRRAAAEIFMPFTVGGGVRTLEDFRRLLAGGADKVSINTAAVDTPELITQAAERFGAQCVVVSIDYRRDADGAWRVWTAGGRRATGRGLVAWAVEAERRGAGELLVTSIERDGTSRGLDLEATRAVTQAVRIPVIAAGGCGLAQHFAEGILAGGASAVAAGTFFCFKDQNPMQTRAHIRNAGVPIRLHT